MGKVTFLETGSGGTLWPPTIPESRELIGPKSRSFFFLLVCDKFHRYLLIALRQEKGVREKVWWKPESKIWNQNLLGEVRG